MPTNVPALGFARKARLFPAAAMAPARSVRARLKKNANTIV
jgi:hypothetical protein